MRDSWSSERGTTLTEVLVVMGLSAIVVPALYLAIVSGFRQDQTQDDVQAAEVQVRHLTGLLTADISENWPSDKRAGEPSQELSLEYLDDAGQLVRIFWYVDGTSLVRIETMADSGTTIFKEEMLTGLKVDEVFRYWTADGVEIKGQSIGSCAVRVTVSLRTVANGGDADASFDIAHRTRNPEAEPC